MSDPFLPVLPALRWSEGSGYGLDAPRVGSWLDEGVVGFILFGGTAEAAREASERLRTRAGRPLLLGADLERGVGQQFQGATALPPLAALAADGSLERLFEAGALTGREAVAVGVPWVFAPVADLSLDPRNPIVGTRSPGGDPDRVAEAVTAWIAGCLSAGALPCVKHFPGHGRTVEDSHRTLPVVTADRETMAATDQVPFRAAIRAGVPSVMTAHVAYPALDPSGRPATRSRPILHDLLREELGFDGVVVTDALIMEGVGDAATSVVEALQAGVDLLLYPPEELPVGEILAAAREEGRLDPSERRRSRERVARLLGRIGRRSTASGPPGPASVSAPSRTSAASPPWGTAADGGRALRWAVESLGDEGWGWEGCRAVSITVADDDVGGPFPSPARDAFPAALREAGVTVGEDDPGDRDAGGPGGRGAGDPGPPVRDAVFPLLCVYAEPRGWKGRAGLSPAARDRVRSWAERCGGRGGVVAFGGPTLLGELPPGLPTLLAWGGESLMQTAAAWRIAGRRSPPAGLGAGPGEGGP